MNVELFDHIAGVVSLSEEQKNLALRRVRFSTVRKREYLFRPGATATDLTFVVSGCLRLFSTDEKGIDRTLQFGFEGWWLADWDSFRYGNPTAFSLQAIEDASVATVSRENYERLLTEIPGMERYFRLTYESIVDMAFRRIYDNKNNTAEDLYYQFQRDHPEVLQRVPQYMLASCLGFTPEFLSMIRAKKTGSKSRS